jgi:hypothetical protein
MAEFLTSMEGWDSFKPVTSGTNPLAEARALNLIRNADRVSPRKHAAMMEEAITTSDFPYLFGQILDRQLLANYRSVQSDWRSYVRVSSVADFNTVRREKLRGLDNQLAKVVEKGEYLASKPTNSRYTYSLAKYGRQFDISWESIINDSLGAFGDIPTRFATAAIRTEERFVTGLYAVAGGTGNTALYGATITDDGQAITNKGSLPLSITNLETTLGLMQNQTDPNGEPIGITARHLVVPPQLELSARSILSSTIKQYSEGAAGTPTPYPTVNVLPQLGIQLHVNPFLPIIDTTKGTTGWYLFADPSEGASLEVGFLRGHETPEIVMKNSDKVSVGGGVVSPFEGDFATDNIFYRVRHVIGGGQLDPRFTYFQSG